MTYTDKERLSIFKREARSYYLYQSRIQKLNEELKHIQHQMENVHSPILNRMGAQPRPDAKDEMLAKLITDKSVVLELQVYYQERMNWLVETIESMASSAYKVLVWMTYVQGKTLQQVAVEYDVSREHLYRLRKYYVVKVMTDERIEELIRIEQSKPILNESEEKKLYK